MTTEGSGVEATAHTSRHKPAAIDGSATARLPAQPAATAADLPAEPATPADVPAVAEPMPQWVFAVALGWLAFVLAVFVVYETVPGFRAAFPAKLGPYIPVTVPWFGALGGCLVSLAGIADHNRQWDSRYDYWHPIRPLVGGVTGAIGCLLLLVTTQLATKGPIKADAAFYDAVAFVFGYAESAFRGLITSLTDVILRPGGQTGRR
jgi:hypothetical protein